MLPVALEEKDDDSKGNSNFLKFTYYIITTPDRASIAAIHKDKI